MQAKHPGHKSKHPWFLKMTQWREESDGKGTKDPPKIQRESRERERMCYVMTAVMAKEYTPLQTNQKKREKPRPLQREDIVIKIVSEISTTTSI